MNNRDLGLFLVRLALAIVFIAHGWAKIMDIPGATMFFEKLNIPMAGIAVYVVTAVEFLGGIAMLLGVLTRWVGLLMAIDMIVAIVVAKLQKGFMWPMQGKYELELMLLLCSLAIAFTEAGAYSVMNFFKKDDLQI